MSFYPLSLAEKESEAVNGAKRRLTAVLHYVRDCKRGQDGGCSKLFSPVAIPTPLGILNKLFESPQQRL